MDPMEIVWGSIDWIQLAQDRDQQQAREYGHDPSGSGATELVIVLKPAEHLLEQGLKV
jgi:hypothetical protein